MQEVSEEQNALKSERESVAQNIDSDTMSKYAEKHEEGLVVAEILDNSCEGCGAMVPPQIINEALSKISFFVVTEILVDKDEAVRVVGIFDPLHVGHLEYFKLAKQLGENYM